MYANKHIILTARRSGHARANDTLLFSTAAKASTSGLCGVAVGDTITSIALVVGTTGLAILGSKIAAAVCAGSDTLHTQRIRREVLSARGSGGASNAYAIIN